MRDILWEPTVERKQQANMTRFIKLVQEKYGLEISSYDQLYDWSVNKMADFWETMWEFGDIRASRSYDQVAVNLDKMLETQWFTGAELNFAENLLRYRDDRVALIFKGEGLEPVSYSYSELYRQVARLAKSLREAGVKKGDRVAGFMPDMAETVMAMLAAVSLGAIWSSCSPDFGINGVIDRFGQIQPKILFTANGYFYNGKVFDCLEKVQGIISQISTIETVVVVPYTKKNPNLSPLTMETRRPAGTVRVVRFPDFLAEDDDLEMQFTPVPFNHPLYIMYSSGTTGVPKCIVHGTGGTLIQHLKELMLHTDLKREDTIFYFTTCGWMMWNWLVSALAVGASLVLFDGSPFYPDSSILWKLAEETGISVFGTSSKYLAQLEKSGLKPGQQFELGRLKTVLSTGSPLSEESFKYVYRDIKQDVCLSSISGGTDIISCFALGNPIGPVRIGELQCRGLGMKVLGFNSAGTPVTGEKGELVCSAPFPSMPVFFWDDPDREKLKKAYFDDYPTVWLHGDFIEITEGGGVVIYGRSDTTLNPAGVRIGTAEIYRQVETLPEILDSLVIGQRWDNDIRVILFVKMAANVQLTEELKLKIKKTIKQNTTPRHVPDKIIAVQDIPYTLSGKKTELAVSNVVHSEPVKNRDALANPDALDFFKDLPELEG